MRASITSWGPAGWTFLHTISFVYPENPTIEDKQRVVDFLFAFTDVIPCQRCRSDFTHMLHENFGSTKEIALNSKFVNNRNALSRILVDMHNRVNERLKKRIVSYEKVVEIYTQDQPNWVGMIVIALLSFISIYLVLRLASCKKKQKE